MKRILVTLFLVFAAAACGSTTSTDTTSGRTVWNLQAENTYLNSCSNKGYARSTCTCTLRGLEAETAGPGDVTDAIAGRVAAACT